MASGQGSQTVTAQFSTIDPSGLASALRAGPNDIVILDFDETLFLRNSTQLFLRTVGPRLYVRVLLKLLRVLKPWRWRHKAAVADYYRDAVMVGVIRFCAPWSLKRWRRKAPQLAAKHVNHALVSAVQDLGTRRVIIMTFGFTDIVAPLLAQTEFADAELIGAELGSAGDWRAQGKLTIARMVLSEEELDQAALVTDSLDDEDLLARVGNGLLVDWRG